MSREAARAAMYAYFQVNPGQAFHAGVDGKLAYVKARRDWQLPYAIFFFVSSHNGDTFTETIDGRTIQVSVFAGDSLTVDRLIDACAGLFHGAVIHGEGVRDFTLLRVGETPTRWADDAWQADLEFSCLVQAD